RRRVTLFALQLRELLPAEIIILQVAVRCQGVETGELKELFDAVLAEKTLERRDAHVRRLRMAQVIFNQIGDALPDHAAPLQPLEDRDRHLRALFRVAVKRDALLAAGGGDGLADVVQQRSVSERLRGRGELL